MQSLIWEEALILNPILTDPCKLGWKYQDGCLTAVLSELPPAPSAVVELVRCKCGLNQPDSMNKCASFRCSSRVNMLACTELCKCEGDSDHCQNVTTNVIDD